jgi:hypothetical protein
MQQAKTLSLTLMVTRLLCAMHKLVLLKTSIMKYSAASWRARTAVLCICRLLFPIFCASLAYKMLEGGFSDEEICFFLKLVDLP